MLFSMLHHFARPCSFNLCYFDASPPSPIHIDLQPISYVSATSTTHSGDKQGLRVSLGAPVPFAAAPGALRRFERSAGGSAPPTRVAEAPPAIHHLLELQQERAKHRPVALGKRERGNGVELRAGGCPACRGVGIGSLCVCHERRGGWSATSAGGDAPKQGRGPEQPGAPPPALS